MSVSPVIDIYLSSRTPRLDLFIFRYYYNYIEGRSEKDV